MTAGQHLDDKEDDAVIADVVAMAGAPGAAWFPELQAGPVASSVISVQRRPRCRLWRIALEDGSSRRDIVVKVRHVDPLLRRVDLHAGRRPVLTPERVLSPREASGREYEGLRLVASAFEDEDPTRFGVLRPLAWLPEHAAVVMEHRDERTLGTALRRHRARSSSQPDDRVWSGLGSWLARFHAAGADLPLPPRLVARHEVVEWLGGAAAFVATAAADSDVVGPLATAAAERLHACLPAVLPHSVGHGDFTAPNVFLGPRGRVTVFDPMPLWQTPVFEDLARLTTSLRVRDLGRSARSAGRATELDRREALILDGYFSPGEVPADALHCFQAMVLLDRWGDLVSKQSRGAVWRRSLRALRVRRVSAVLRHEAHRLTGVLHASEAAGPATES